MSKRGNLYLRRRLIHGARVVLFCVNYDTGIWIVGAPAELASSAQPKCNRQHVRIIIACPGERFDEHWVQTTVCLPSARQRQVSKA